MNTRKELQFPEIHRLAARLQQICESCHVRLAHQQCCLCQKRLCNACQIEDLAMPCESFCSEECRHQVESASIAGEQADRYAFYAGLQGAR